MQTDEVPKQDGVKTKCEGHEQTLKRLLMILTFSVLKKMANNPFKNQSIAKTTFTRRSGTVIELFGRQKM
jgi:hypothetical protein